MTVSLHKGFRELPRGSQRWFDYYVKFLRDNLKLEGCKVNPSIMKFEQGPMIMHVDDSLTLAPLSWLHTTLIPLIKSRFEVSVELAWKVGDEFSFLKSKHLILEDSIVVSMPAQYIHSMAKVLDVKPSSRATTPYCAELLNVDTSAPLGTEDTAKFRSAVGIALYISADRVDVSFAVRVLASGMAKPTKLLLKGVIRLTQYLLNTLTYAMALKPGARGCSKLHGDPKGSRDDSRDLLEVFTDSDWSGNRVDGVRYSLHQRRSGSFKL